MKSLYLYKLFFINTTIPHLIIYTDTPPFDDDIWTELYISSS